MKKILSSLLLAVSALSLSCCFFVTPSPSDENSESITDSSSTNNSISSEESISESSQDSSVSNEESSSPNDFPSDDPSSSPSEELIGFSITSNDTNGKTIFSKSKGLEEGELVEVTFKPNSGYSLLSYIVTDETGSFKIPAYKKDAATLTITSNTAVEANYVKNSLINTFNYCSGTSKLYHYVDGTYQNSNGDTAYSYEDVISCIKDENGNVIDSSIFSISPITTFENGKWVNLFYTNKGYGLSLYSSETEYSGITFTSSKTIYSITINYYDTNYTNRALIESNGSTLTGFEESETSYTYLIDGNDFSITNISGGKYLYIPSIEIVYEGDGLFNGPITIKYDANGGVGTMNNQTVDTQNFNLSESQFSKPGYNFVGWADTPNGSMLYGDGESISGNIVSDTTLYAVYEFEPNKSAELINIYQQALPNNIDDVYAYYGGEGTHDITKYIPNFDPNLTDMFELQFGKIVYVGTNTALYEHVTKNFIPVSQSYKTAENITLLDAYLELAYAYYYQGTQIQYDQGSSYQRKIRNMKPEDATELYQKYMDCSTFVSNAFYNAFNDTIIPNADINSITTKTIINFARENIGKSNEVVLYQDNLANLTAVEKTTALNAFKAALQPGDLYVYRHGGDSAGHVMLYVGNGYFLHSTGSSYNYTSLVDKTESFTSVEGVMKPEGSVRYQSVNSTVYKTSSTRYLFYVDSAGEDSNDRYAILRPLNRKGLSITPTTIARCMASSLEIEKSADNTTSVALGNTITYTISITNNSSKAINNVSITDTIDENVKFVSMDKSYNYYQYGNQLIYNIPSIGANKTIAISYKVTATSDISNIGKLISSTGKIGHLSLNTLNMSISSLNDSQLNDFVTMALQYYNNPNVSYNASGNNSDADPTNNVITFTNGANFINAVYKRYYASLGKSLELVSELSTVTNTNFMNSIMSTTGTLQSTTLLGKMLVNGGYGGTVYTKNYDMDRMRTIKPEYLLPGDIISFVNSSATNQYLYLGDVVINSVTYKNALLLFTTSTGVKMVSESDADALLVKLIGYKKFAVIRPSLYM